MKFWNVEKSKFLSEKFLSEGGRTRTICQFLTENELCNNSITISIQYPMHDFIDIFGEDWYI